MRVVVAGRRSGGADDRVATVDDSPTLLLLLLDLGVRDDAGVLRRQVVRLRLLLVNELLLRVLRVKRLLLLLLRLSRGRRTVSQLLLRLRGAHRFPRGRRRCRCRR